MTLSERVAELRKAQRISQDRLAEKAGIPRPIITRLEAGNQKSVLVETAVRLARAFGLTVDEFLKGVDIDLAPAVA
jgi:transcriptional regulator with XRE-family HTH domain